MSTDEIKDSPLKKQSSKKVPADDRYASKKFAMLKEAIEKVSEPEGKIEQAIGFMREALSQPEGPSLKDFWDAKHLCASLFKLQMNPIKRNHLWSEFTELNQEAKKLKEIVDEQVAFAVEQLELAIKALEADFDHYDRLVQQTSYPQLSKDIKKLTQKEEFYKEAQKELALLKTLVGRLDALRQEIIDTDMRISVKNKLLKRLSKIGDHIFPKRKELVKQVSDQFVHDVECFVKEKFGSNEKSQQPPCYVLREDIKSLQSLAKVLTLNTQAFNKTRKLLSECWDQIKEEAKERKKEYEEKSKEFKQNEIELEKKIVEYENFCSKEDNLVKEKIFERASALQDEMKSLPLSREISKQFILRIQKIRKEALSKIQEKLDEKKKIELSKIESFKQELKNLVQEEGELSIEALTKDEERLLEAFQGFSLTSMDRHICERYLSDLRSFILDKKEKNTSELEDLENILFEREALLSQIKEQVEIYRKEMGGSGLDFEKAMIYRELYDSAKIHLDKEAEATACIEEKIIEKES